MKLKILVLVLVGVLSLVLPVMSFAQDSASVTGSTSSSTSTIVPVSIPTIVPIASNTTITNCTMPVNPVNASDWTSTIACLQGQINTLQAKVIALESNTNVSATSVPSSSLSTADTIAIQNFLKAGGYFNYPTATGYYGPITSKAVKDFQEKEGLSGSGEVDAETLQKIKDLAPTLLPSDSSAIQQLQLQGQAQTQIQNQTQDQTQTQNQIQNQPQTKSDN